MQKNVCKLYSLLWYDILQINTLTKTYTKTKCTDDTKQKVTTQMQSSNSKCCLSNTEIMLKHTLQYNYIVQIVVYYNIKFCVFEYLNFYISELLQYTLVQTIGALLYYFCWYDIYKKWKVHVHDLNIM